MTRAAVPSAFASLVALLAAAPGAAAQTPARPELDLSVLEQLGGVGKVTISADDARVSASEPSRFSGNVEIESDGTRVSADAAAYDPVEQRFTVEGNVNYEDDRVAVGAGEALFDTDSDEGEFRNARFALKDAAGRGDADSIRSDGQDFLELRGVRYSACPEDELDWRLIAHRIRIDTERDIGEGRDVRVEFKGVPILYAPYLSFPASGARKSGFLLPDYGNTDRSGNELSIPYYWNIAPNYDATITARYLTARGAQLGVETRYLLPDSEGSVEAVYLADDMRADRDRYLSHWTHDSWFANGLRLHADITDVSDSDYFADLSSSLAGTSVTHLERLLEIQLNRDDWLVAARMQAFQTIDPAIAEANEPYKRVPQLVFAGHWDAAGGLDLGLSAELTHFERSAGARGQRFDVEPRIAWPLETAGMALVPEIRVNHAQYALSDLPAGRAESPSRTTPIYSLDGKLIFERSAGRDASLLHTFEPRVRYTHVPFSEQDDLPVFDTGVPDFNLVQLFQDNRYQGVDRIGDTDKLSIGFTTRLFDTRDGRELFSATLGQALFLSERGVQLPGRPVADTSSSNLIAEVGVDLSRTWNADIEYQWQPEASETAKAAVRLQYRPAADKVINVAYRFQDNELEQSDLSFAWPVGSYWNLVGRWNYSLQENVTLERFAGLEYERCCWAIRLVSRSYVNNRDGSTDKALFAQFELKGLTSIGTRVDAFLERGILGYGREID